MAKPSACSCCTSCSKATLTRAAFSMSSLVGSRISLAPWVQALISSCTAASSAAVIRSSKVFSSTATTSAPRRFFTSSGLQAGFVPWAGGNSRIRVRFIMGTTRSSRNARSSSS